MKSLATILVLLLAGCCTCQQCIDIDEQKLQQAIEVKEFLEQNDISLQKLKKCIDIADKIELNESSIVVEDGVLQLLVR